MQNYEILDQTSRRSQRNLLSAFLSRDVICSTYVVWCDRLCNSCIIAVSVWTNRQQSNRGAVRSNDQTTSEPVRWNPIVSKFVTHCQITREIEPSTQAKVCSYTVKTLGFSEYWRAPVGVYNLTRRWLAEHSWMSPLTFSDAFGCLIRSIVKGSEPTIPGHLHRSVVAFEMLVM